MTNGCIPLALSFLQGPEHNPAISVDLLSSVNLINIIPHQHYQKLNNSFHVYYGACFLGDSKSTQVNKHTPWLRPSSTGDVNISLWNHNYFSHEIITVLKSQKSEINVSSNSAMSLTVTRYIQGYRVNISFLKVMVPAKQGMMEPKQVQIKQRKHQIL